MAEKQNPAEKRNQGKMTVEEAGRKGGEKTSETHGREFYEEIGHKGGKTRGQEIHEAAEYFREHPEEKPRNR